MPSAKRVKEIWPCQRHSARRRPGWRWWTSPRGLQTAATHAQHAIQRLPGAIVRVGGGLEAARPSNGASESPTQRHPQRHQPYGGTQSPCASAQACARGAWRGAGGASWRRCARRRLVRPRPTRAAGGCLPCAGAGGAFGSARPAPGQRSARRATRRPAMRRPALAQHAAGPPPAGLRGWVGWGGGDGPPLADELPHLARAPCVRAISRRARATPGRAPSRRVGTRLLTSLNKRQRPWSIWMGDAPRGER